jgi:ribonuclease P protein component
VGLIVPKYRQTGVARNRLKRRLKELARLRILPMGIAADIVIRVRADAYDASFEALTADVMKALEQLAAWSRTPPRTSPDPTSDTA